MHRHKDLAIIAEAQVCKGQRAVLKVGNLQAAAKCTRSAAVVQRMITVRT
jgi:hypothetical protein